jgi:CheY-like chemotaxis protein
MQPAHAKVLVVEHDESMRELIYLHLRNEGYDVALAEDAVVGGRKLLHSPPNVIVIDIETPFMNGLEFASILLSDATLPDIPIILISAHDYHRERADLLGVVFLQKPLQKTKLLQTVADAVATRSFRGNALLASSAHAL